MFQEGDLVYYEGSASFCVVVKEGFSNGSLTYTHSRAWGVWEDTEEEALASYFNLKPHQRKPRSDGGRLTFVEERSVRLVGYATRKDTVSYPQKVYSISSFFRKMDKEYS